MGQKLIAAAEEQAQSAFGVKRVFARVVMDNRDGEKVFAQAGYKNAGTSFRLDDPATKLLIMTKTLG